MHRTLIRCALLALSAAVLAACGDAVASVSPDYQALDSYRTAIHAKVTVLQKDERAVEGCGGGGVISDPTDCHRAIATLAADATATLHLVTSTPAPDGEGKIPKELTDALRQLVEGCNADDAALADASVELYLPGQATVDALNTVVVTDQSLQMF